MRSNSTMPAASVLASVLEKEWRQGGWKQGPPAHILEAYLAADKRIYSRGRCPACNHRGMKVVPFHRGSEYRLLCRCRACNAGLET